MKFKSKPREIEAFEIHELCASAAKNWSALPPEVAGAYERGEVIFLDQNHLSVKTLKGWMNANDTDMLIFKDGELYPCPKVSFESNYE